jgi:hypothetical protein
MGGFFGWLGCKAAAALSKVYEKKCWALLLAVGVILSLWLSPPGLTPPRAGTTGRARARRP